MSDDDCSDQPKRSPKKTPFDEKHLTELLLLPAWTEEQAAQVLHAQVQSGQSVCGFSRQRGVTPSRLYKWQRRLSGSSAGSEAEPPQPFVKVALPPQDSDSQTERTTAAVATDCITVRMPSGVQILIPQGAPESLISTVLWALRTEPC